MDISHQRVGKFVQPMARVQDFNLSRMIVTDQKIKLLFYVFVLLNCVFDFCNVDCTNKRTFFYFYLFLP